jgi:hypothetical protein
MELVAWKASGPTPGVVVVEPPVAAGRQFRDAEPEPCGVVRRCGPAVGERPLSGPELPAGLVSVRHRSVTTQAGGAVAYSRVRANVAVHRHSGPAVLVQPGHQRRIGCTEPTGRTPGGTGLHSSHLVRLCPECDLAAAGTGPAIPGNGRQQAVGPGGYPAFGRRRVPDRHSRDPVGQPHARIRVPCRRARNHEHPERAAPPDGQPGLLPRGSPAQRVPSGRGCQHRGQATPA